MTYRGAELIAWATRKADEWLDTPTSHASTQAVAQLIAESYLRGAIDALAEETELKKLDRDTADSVPASDARGMTNGG